MGFDELSPELQEKAKACNTPEELKALCSEEGIKLSDEEIMGLAGGGSPLCSKKHCLEYSTSTCPKAKR